MYTKPTGKSLTNCPERLERCHSGSSASQHHRTMRRLAPKQDYREDAPNCDIKNSNFYYDCGTLFGLTTERRATPSGRHIRTSQVAIGSQWASRSALANASSTPKGIPMLRSVCRGSGVSFLMNERVKRDLH